ncbi:MAG: NifB/NifX family molybdenum-iron cluster-binding protein [Planctomycetes bacterium]|nr:NifB/NifX family molybdenum-iron cluster-binding protein [Planctomycetota bacterium]
MKERVAQAGGAAVVIDEFTAQIKRADANAIFIMVSIALVLILGLYALFSEHDTPVVGNPACGKIVIAADGAKLNSSVAASLAAAPYFQVIEPLSGKQIEVFKNPFIGTASNGQDVSYFIASKGEEAVIAGQVNQASDAILTNLGIRVFAGFNGPIVEAVELYRQARISHSLRVQGRGGRQGNNSPALPVAFGQGPLFSCPACQLTVDPAVDAIQPPQACPQCQFGMGGHIHQPQQMQNQQVGFGNNGAGFLPQQIQNQQAAFGNNGACFIPQQTPTQQAAFGNNGACFIPQQTPTQQAAFGAGGGACIIPNR